jgi:hypothetical protein
MDFKKKRFMRFSTVVGSKLLGSIQIPLLLGILSVAILAAEPVKVRLTLAYASTRLSVVPVQATQTNSLLYGASFQQTDGWALIKTEEGVLFVWNTHELHLTLAVKGKDIKRVNDPDHIFLAVDGKMLQIQAAAIRDFAPDAKERKLDDKAVLAAHRDWESKYIEGLLKHKLTLHSFSVNTSALGTASLWEFDMPEGMNAEARTQLYVTVVRGDYVVMLNCEATTTTSEVEVRKFLLDTFATLEISSDPFDVQKLSESIRTGRKP